MKVIVDRIEENKVVCEIQETGEMINIDISSVPLGTKSGDVLCYSESGIAKIDVDTTKEVENRIKDKMDSLWE